MEYDDQEVPVSMDKYPIHGSEVSMGTMQHIYLRNWLGKSINFKAVLTCLYHQVYGSTSRIKPAKTSPGSGSGLAEVTWNHAIYRSLYGGKEKKKNKKQRNAGNVACSPYHFFTAKDSRDVHTVYWHTQRLSLQPYAAI